MSRINYYWLSLLLVLSLPAWAEPEKKMNFSQHQIKVNAAVCSKMTDEACEMKQKPESLEQCLHQFNQLTVGNLHNESLKNQVSRAKSGACIRALSAFPVSKCDTLLIKSIQPPCDMGSLAP